MLITETITLNGKEFVHNYSDNGHYIIREDGKKFVDAIDVIDSGHTYTESEEIIPQEEEPEID